MNLSVRRKRGVALIAALAILALTATAIAALTGTLWTLDRLARQARAEAQLQQLLLAGTDQALAAPENKAVEIALPASLAEEGAKVIVRRSGSSAQIEAWLGKSRREQRAQWDAGGKLVRVESPADAAR